MSTTQILALSSLVAIFITGAYYFNQLPGRQLRLNLEQVIIFTFLAFVLETALLLATGMGWWSLLIGVLLANLTVPVALLLGAFSRRPDESVEETG